MKKLWNSLNSPEKFLLTLGGLSVIIGASFLMMFKDFGDKEYEISPVETNETIDEIYFLDERMESEY